MAAVAAPVVVLRPPEDMLRILVCLEAYGVAPLLAACTPLWHKLWEPMAQLRKSGAGGGQDALEAQMAAMELELALAEVSRLSGDLSAPLPTFKQAWDGLQALETSMHTEMRYVYGPDWEVKPGKLVSKKGTWSKKSTKFSWEILEQDKLYMPHGIVMPVLQIGRVTDPLELKRHEWTQQHLRVWLKPAIIRTLEARRGVWFVYYPHWHDEGTTLVAHVDTWLKRTTQMSGDLQPFELIYVPKGLPLRLIREAQVVDEEWERYRHQHVQQHRRVQLMSPPITVKQDKYDIFVGQAEDKPYSTAAASSSLGLGEEALAGSAQLARAAAP